jgi:hypothetical protein
VRRISLPVGLTLGTGGLALILPLVLKTASASGVENLVMALQLTWFAGLLWCLLKLNKSLWLIASAPFALFWPWTLLVVTTIGCGLHPCD